MVFDKHSRQPRRRSAGGSGIVQDQGRIQTERAGIHSPAATVSAALWQDASQGAHQLLPTARRQQRRLGQYRHFRLARLRHADQSGLSLPGFHSGRSDRTGSCLVPRSGTARGHARDSGMAQLLLQITMTAPPLYPEHDFFLPSMKLKNTLRWMVGEDVITHLGQEYYD